MADKYYITGDINTTNKNYGEKRVEIGGSGSLVLEEITVSDTQRRLSATWREITDAMASGTMVVLPYVSSDNTVYQYRLCLQARISDNSYMVGFFVGGATDAWYTDSADGYPSQSDDI